ncbi:MAG TPA: SRPBCC family protein [Mycobacteriales bacterium]|nr:SRPBCC family protein [Mycobacteriales bacterium]
MNEDAERRVVRSTEVAAPPQRVWALVSDLPGMSRFSPESTGGRWEGEPAGPVVGARFRGTNVQGRRRWSTRSTVVEAEPGRAFAFEVTSMGLPVALWRYQLEPTGSGCLLTESWTDRRGRLVTAVGALTTGVKDRRGYAGTSMELTLQRVKQEAEKSVGPVE